VGDRIIEPFEAATRPASTWLNLPSTDSTRPRMRQVEPAKRTNLPEWEGLKISRLASLALTAMRVWLLAACVKGHPLAGLRRAACEQGSGPAVGVTAPAPPVRGQARSCPWPSRAP
jgi:hypothetical protein